MSEKTLTRIWKSALVIALACGLMFGWLWQGGGLFGALDEEESAALMAMFVIFAMSAVMLAVGAYLFAEIKQLEKRK
jgi:hypothetical protein